MTKKYELLIVEDRQDEMHNAISSARKYGISDIKTADNLSDALSKFSSARSILTDMFFPGGNMDCKPYIGTFLPFYEDGKLEALQRLKNFEGSSLYRAAKQTFPNNTLNDVVPNLKRMGFSEDIQKGLADMLNRHNNLTKQSELCSDIAKKVSEGTILPLGMVLGRHARLAKIPVVVVTSANHHDAYLQPITGAISQLGLDYVDSYDGGKDWNSGLRKLSRQAGGEK